MFRFHRADYESNPFCSSLSGLEPFWKCISNALVCILVMVYITPAQHLVHKHCCLMKRQRPGETMQPSAKLSLWFSCSLCFRGTCSIPFPERLASCCWAALVSKQSSCKAWTHSSQNGTWTQSLLELSTSPSLPFLLYCAMPHLHCGDAGLSCSLTQRTQ